MTSASSGWLLAVRGDDAEVMAGTGSAAGAAGRRVTPTGAQAYVLLSGQAVALLPQPDDPANDDAGGFAGVPPSVVAVPCGDEPIGVLEVVDKVDGLPFNFDDIELLTALAAVAGAALAEGSADAGSEPAVSPATLADGLERLATVDPGRYADTARLVAGLLDR
ncbi:MAG: GAF domain-containing protein [Actinomycetota bacterium]